MLALKRIKYMYCKMYAQFNSAYPPYSNVVTKTNLEVPDVFVDSIYTGKWKYVKQTDDDDATAKLSISKPKVKDGDEHFDFGLFCGNIHGYSVIKSNTRWKSKKGDQTKMHIHYDNPKTKESATALINHLKIFTAMDVIDNQLVITSPDFTSKWETTTDFILVV